jgi:hypothetical protein
MTTQKRPLLKSESDWVVIVSLLLGGSTGYQSVNSSYFLYGNSQFDTADFVAALIDSIIGTTLTFLICVAILGSIRRRSSKGADFKEGFDNRPKNLKIRIATAVFVVSLIAVLVAWSNATVRNPDAGSTGRSLEVPQIESRPRTCSPQGEDEKCVSAFAIGKHITLNFELNYKTLREANGYSVASSTWVIDIDCEAKSIVASKLKFLDSNDIEVVFPAGQIENALVQIKDDYAKTLDEC